MAVAQPLLLVKRCFQILDFDIFVLHKEAHTQLCRADSLKTQQRRRCMYVVEQESVRRNLTSSTIGERWWSFASRKF